MTRRGYTLLELLAALALATTMLLLTAHVFSSAARGRESLRERGGETAALQRAFQMMARDLHSMVVPPDDSGLLFGLSAGPAATASSVLQFAAAVGEPLLAGRTATETVLIQYGIMEDPRSGRSGLWRFETAYPVPEGSGSAAEEPGRSLLLLPGAVGATYLFYNTAEQSWVESWEEQPGLPTAIRVDVVLPADTEAGEPRLESWTFSIPGAGYANDEAAEAQAAEEQSAAGASP